MLDLRQVFSLTDFLRNHKEHVARLVSTRKPVVLTVKGKPALVNQDAELAGQSGPQPQSPQPGRSNHRFIYSQAGGDCVCPSVRAAQIGLRVAYYFERPE
jgi:hypothetical protein